MRTLITIICLLFFVTQALAAPPKAPPRERGDGPYERLILRGVTLVNGEGAPPYGPVDIVIEDDRITEIVSVGNPGMPIKAERRPQAEAGDKEMDLRGHYVLPGFIDMHGHIGGSAEGTICTSTVGISVMRIGA